MPIVSFKPSRPSARLYRPRAGQQRCSTMPSTERIAPRKFGLRKCTFIAMLASTAALGCSGGQDNSGTLAVTTSTSEQAIAPETSEDAADVPARGALEFRGDEDKRLPPFRVQAGGGLLRWTNAGEVFSLFSHTGTLVDSVAPSGEVVLRPGVQTIDVIASGGWSITVFDARRVR
jgi:hypothetical protein